MAKISARQTTDIGYTGTTGGRISWINQAGSAGKGLVSLGSSVEKSANALAKAFDDSISEAQRQQQVDILKSAYINWDTITNQNLRNGGVGLDQNGVPSSNFELGSLAPTSIENHKTWYEENVSQDLDPFARSEFNVWFAEKQRAAYDLALKLDREHKTTKLLSEDESIFNTQMSVIMTAQSSSDVIAAYDLIQEMAEKPANYRDQKDWAKKLLTAESETRIRLAVLESFNEQGKSIDPSDLNNGYSAEEYRQAIGSILNHKDLTDSEKTTIRENLQPLLTLREKIEKIARDKVFVETNDDFYTQFIANKLTPDMIRSAFIGGRIDDAGQRYWMDQITGSKTLEKEKWEEHYWLLYDYINRGSFPLTDANSTGHYTFDPALDRNNIFRGEDLSAVITKAAQSFDIPMEYVVKLRDYAVNKSTANPLFKKKETAINYANDYFAVPVSPLDAMLSGQQLISREKMRKQAAQKKLFFASLLEKRLDEGFKEGKSWDSMLSVGDPDYIVFDVIKEINEQYQPEEDDTTIPAEDDTKYFWENWFSANEIADPSIPRAATENALALNVYGDSNHRLIVPEGLEDKFGWPDGKEPIENWLARTQGIV